MKYISREKLISWLKASYSDAMNVTSTNQYLYITGRNSVVNNLLVGIYLGEFEDSDRSPGRIDLEIAGKSSETAPAGTADAMPRSPTIPMGMWPRDEDFELKAGSEQR